jgi:hypothetical protein
MHVSPLAHTTPHPPQLFTSLVVLRHPLGQQVVPPVQAGPPLQLVGTLHAPDTHVSPAAQGMPHPPQFFTSLDVSLHPFAQQVSLPVQTGPPLQFGGAVQLAPTHASPGGQTWPHPPQLLGSLSMSLHPDMQHWSTPVQTGPPLHDVGGWQFPCWQVSPGGQPKPHPLQLFGSVFVSVHPDGQHCSTPLQAGPPLQEVVVGMHVPPWQASPFGQKLLQPPQLFGSLVVSTQPDGQQVSVPPQGGAPLQLNVSVTQPPPAQCWLSAQRLLQPPQFWLSVRVSVQPLSQQLSAPVQTGPPWHVFAPLHAPETHVSSVAHTLTHAPQCSGETCVFTHVSPQQVSPTEQPTVAQPDGGWHAPARQASPFGHVRPHVPQSCGFVPSSTQVDPQQSCPALQSGPAPHTPTHSKLSHASPGGHSLDVRQPTHSRVAGSQMGFVAGHCASLEQPPGGSELH